MKHGDAAHAASGDGRRRVGDVTGRLWALPGLLTAVSPVRSTAWHAVGAQYMLVASLHGKEELACL